MVQVFDKLQNASPNAMADFLAELNNGNCDSCPAFRFCNISLDHPETNNWTPETCPKAFRQWIVSDANCPFAQFDI